MKRRQFIKRAAISSVGVAAVGCTRTGGERASEQRQLEPPRMKVGCQYGGVGTKRLEFLARHGVHHYDPGSPEHIDGVGWSIDDARQQVEACQEYGITLEAFHLPLTAGGIDNQRYPNIMLGKSPERDREIEIIQQMISVAGQVGVPKLLYNTTILPILRTGRTEDSTRGNATYSTWDYEVAVGQGMDQELTLAGEVDVDELYERITYFLDRVLPVAEEYNVKLGNHIADPPAPAGYRGVTRWNSPEVFEGIRRYAELYNSPFHGFNLCLGSVAEGLKDPETEIFPVIEYLGEREQIFNIHLRNIKGGWNYFEEVYPDNGVMNFVEVMRTLRNVGYDGMVMPDHVPQHPAEGSRNQGYAFAYGYIKALIQMLDDEAAQA